jgi:hypothetical protein
MTSLRSAVLNGVSSSLSLTQSLTTPNKVAHVFDWKKATSNVLMIRITKQSMECAIASHPMLDKRDASLSSSSSIQSFTSIPLVRDKSRHSTTGTPNQRLSSTSPPPSFNVSDVTQSLQRLMVQHHVCGIIVLYPTTGPIGWKNASCGRTLHVLDHITLQSMNLVVSNVSSNGSNSNNNNSYNTNTTTSKPICLYDPNHYQNDLIEDEWGRTPLYVGTTTTTTTTKAKVVHCAQMAQSNSNSHTILEQTWKNFCHHYWPNSSVDESDRSNDDDDDDLSNFMTKLSNQKNYNQMNHHHGNTTYVINNGNSKTDVTTTMSPVYQSAF